MIPTYSIMMFLFAAVFFYHFVEAKHMMEHQICKDVEKVLLLKLSVKAHLFFQYNLLPISLICASRTLAISL